MTEAMNQELVNIVESELSRWVRDRIEYLPDRSKHCASNAIRSLYWAGGIATLESTTYREGERGYRVPATFFLMHAMEEAVAAFVACAKEIDRYSKLAKAVNPKDHIHKTTLPWLCSQIVDLLEKRKIQVGLELVNDKIVVSFIDDEGNKSFNVASMGLVSSLDDDGNQRISLADVIYQRSKDTKTIHRLLKENANGRNFLIYADDNGFRTGPCNLDFELRELSKTVMGILWATVDMWEHKEMPIQLVEVILRTTSDLAEAAKQKK